MRNRILAWMAVVGVVLAVVAPAADVDGKWIAQVPGRDGQTREVAFTFRADGNKLTGTMITGTGERYISDGKVNGNEVSFSITMSFGGNETKMLYKGKVSGNVIKFTRRAEGRDNVQQFTAKRAES